ncbi:MAG TPA: transketolase [Gemmatimonadota bacterium]|nr:transketolase [Gemmatimonadota bacterium]
MPPSASSDSFTDLDRLSVNALRALSIDQPQKAESGHPGHPLGAAPMTYVLWQRWLKHNPQDPAWPDRDRYVLSAGHGSALLYSLLNVTGYDLPIAELERFRQWESRTPGHPECFMTAGVEATTGPLGQGCTNAVGMAIAERWLANHFNRPGFPIVDHRTFSILSDGDIMEGVSAEASAIAGFYKLGKLTFLYDQNHVTLDGPASQSMSEDVGKRYQAYGWQVLTVEDGDTDLAAIDDALAAAVKNTAQPTLIIVTTTIGYGSPNKAGTHKAHGEPLGEEEVVLTKRALGWEWPNHTFYVPAEVRAHMDATRRGREAQAAWEEMFAAYAEKHPDLAEEWGMAHSGELPTGWDGDLPSWEPEDEEIATRSAAGKALNAIAARVPWLIGGDADLATSTKTTIEKAGDFDGQTGAGRNLHYGVREHAMAGITSGMAYHGGVRPYAATFFIFSDYMRPAVRLAALNKLPVIYVWTHDSIGLGEDGPTHQPIEHLMSLRAMPNLAVVRPADANEAAAAWRWAMRHDEGPVALVLSRQKLPVIDRQGSGSAELLERGAYVLVEPDDGDPEAIVIATGSEVWKALEAQEILATDGVRARVVSMPCWEAFAEQSAEYRDEVLPPDVSARVSVEAGATLGWERWIGDRGTAIGIDRYGASAPGATNMERLGFTAERIAVAVRALIGQPAAR